MFFLVDGKYQVYVYLTWSYDVYVYFYEWIFFYRHKHTTLLFLLMSSPWAKLRETRENKIFKV